MNRFFKIMSSTLLIGSLIGCGGSKPIVKSSNTQQPFQELERIIERSAPSRPSWTLNEPVFEGSSMYFVGLSGKNATEKGARDDAKRNAAKSIVSYLGTSVKDKFQEITASFGLSSDITNPTKATKGFTEMLSANVAKKMKAKSWYFEKYQTRDGDIYWKFYVLSYVPKAEIQKAFNESVEGEKAKVKDKIKKACTAQAKQQLQNALNAFDQMKNSGIE